MTMYTDDDEPLLTPTTRRFTLGSIEHPDLWQLYNNMLASFWVPNEIDISSDLADWRRLTSDERFFIKRVLAFFAASDGIVNENILRNMALRVQSVEARCCYGYQFMIENVHTQVYTEFLEALVPNAEERESLFLAIEHVPSVTRKARWAMQWIEDDDASFAQRLVAFVIVEGVFFSASFCAIFWLKKRGLMPALAAANVLISRDENAHWKFGTLLHSKLRNRLGKEQIHSMMSAAVECEIAFVEDAIPCGLIGMNAKSMIQYVQFVADVLLEHLSVPRLYNVSNPFDFMEIQGVQTKTNLHEARPENYVKAATYARREYADDEDF